MSVLVRPLEAGDEARWRALWAGYLEFYKTELSDAHRDRLFKRLVAGEPHFAFVAEQAGDVIGFVHAMPMRAHGPKVGIAISKICSLTRQCAAPAPGGR